MMFCSECLVISDWYHSPCLSWNPPNEDDLGRVALLGRGATTLVEPSLVTSSTTPFPHGILKGCSRTRDAFEHCAIYWLFPLDILWWPNIVGLFVCVLLFLFLLLWGFFDAPISISVNLVENP